MSDPTTILKKIGNEPRDKLSGKMEKIEIYFSLV